MWNLKKRIERDDKPLIPGKAKSMNLKKRIESFEEKMNAIAIRLLPGISKRELKVSASSPRTLRFSGNLKKRIESYLRHYVIIEHARARISKRELKDLDADDYLILKKLVGISKRELKDVIHAYLIPPLSGFSRISKRELKVLKKVKVEGKEYYVRISKRELKG